LPTAWSRLKTHGKLFGHFSGHGCSAGGKLLAIDKSLGQGPQDSNRPESA